MKELNLKQMESVNGGLESDCKGALVSLGTVSYTHLTLPTT